MILIFYHDNVTNRDKYYDIIDSNYKDSGIYILKKLFFTSN